MLIIGAVYRSPNGNVHDFLNYFEALFKNDFINDDETIILGDFNIDFKSNTSTSNKIKNIIIDSGFKQIIENPTRITPTSATLVDYIITNNFTVAELPRNFPKISDHDVIGINVPGLNHTSVDKFI